MGQTVLHFLVCLFIPFFAYATLRSAAKAILSGNVSKTRYRKIMKEVSWKEKVKLDFIRPYAKLYKKSLKAIIIFSRVYLIIIFIETAAGVVLLIAGIPKEFWTFVGIVNAAICVPVYIFDLAASYPGWTKDQRKGWRYEIDGKNSRKNKKK